MSMEIKPVRCLLNGQGIESCFLLETSQQLCELVDKLDKIDETDTTLIGVFMPNCRAAKRLLRAFHKVASEKGHEVVALNTNERISFLPPRGRAVEIEFFPFAALRLPGQRKYDYTFFDNAIDSDEKLCNNQAKDHCLNSTAFVWVPISLPRALDVSMQALAVSDDSKDDTQSED